MAYQLLATESKIVVVGVALETGLPCCMMLKISQNHTVSRLVQDSPNQCIHKTGSERGLKISDQTLYITRQMPTR